MSKYWQILARQKKITYFIFIVNLTLFIFNLFICLFSFSLIETLNFLFLARTATTELTVNNKNLQSIGIVDHLANKWGSEDELGEKQSRKMGSRNTQSSAGGNFENMKGPVVIKGHLWEKNLLTHNRNNKTKQGLGQNCECFTLNY